jgi:hypothetical protein
MAMLNNQMVKPKLGHLIQPSGSKVQRLTCPGVPWPVVRLAVLAVVENNPKKHVGPPPN